MPDIQKYILTNVVERIVFPIPGSSSGDTVVCTIYRRSDGLYWTPASSAFAAPSVNFAMTWVNGEFWQTSFTPNTSDVFLVTIEDQTLSVTHHMILNSTGGPVPAPPAAAGATTLTALLDQFLRDIVDEPIGDTDARTSATTCLNNAMQEVIADMLNAGMDFLGMQASGILSTVANQEYSNLSDIGDVDRVYDVYQITDKVKLTKVQRHQYVRDFPDVTQQNKIPEAYAEWNNRLYWWPRPNAIYTMYVDYWKRVGPMSATTDTPPFVAKYNPLLFQYAALWWHQLVEPDDSTKLLRFERRAESLKAKLITNANKHPDEIPILGRHGRRRTGILDWTSPAGQ